MLDNIPPLRVLQVIGCMNRGGAESMVMNLYRTIDKSQVQFDFLVHTNDTCEYDDEIKRLGGRIYSIPSFKAYNAFSYYRHCCDFFKSHPEYKIVHGHIGSSAAIYLAAAKRFGVYTIAHSHNAQRTILNLHDLIYKLFSYPTRYVADYLFGCSTEAGIARYGSKAVNKSGKYKNFCNAIDLNKYRYSEKTRSDVRAELGIDDTAIVIGHVGRITTQKNPEFIYSCFREICERDENAVCLWIGTGEFEKEYLERIKEENYSNRIKMLGVRKDVDRVLNCFDCFLFPSLFEGLPVSVIEAEASGLPCIVSDRITREIDITDLVEWHSLLESHSIWADRCLARGKENRNNRRSPIEEIVRAGYDINSTSKWLAEFYKEKVVR